MVLRVVVIVAVMVSVGAAQTPLETLMAPPYVADEETSYPYLTSGPCHPLARELGLKEGEPFWPLVALLAELDSTGRTESRYLQSSWRNRPWTFLIDRTERQLVPLIQSRENRERAIRISCSSDVSWWREGGLTQVDAECTLTPDHGYKLEVALDRAARVISAAGVSHFHDNSSRRVQCSLGGEIPLPPHAPAWGQDVLGRQLLSRLHVRPGARREPWPRTADFSNVIENALRGLSLSALEARSGVPVFVSGPHGEDGLVQSSSDFGRHNPEFARWLIDEAFPIVRDLSDNEALKTHYVFSVGLLARELYASYVYLQRRPELRARLTDMYREHVREPPVDNRYFHRRRDVRSVLSSAKPLALGSDSFWSYNQEEAAFWLRRHMDGTAHIYAELLEQVLATFDPEFLELVKSFIDFEGLPFHEIHEDALPGSLRLYIGVKGLADPGRAEDTITVLGENGETCAGRLERVDDVPSDCEYERDHPGYLVGEYAFEPTCTVERRVAIVPGEVATLATISDPAGSGPPVESFFEPEEVMNNGVAGPPTPARLEVPHGVGEALHWPSMQAFEERAVFLELATFRDCVSRLAGPLVEVDCGEHGTRLLFHDGNLIARIRSWDPEKGPLAGTSRKPVASYEQGAFEVIVLAPGAALVRSGAKWRLMVREEVQSVCHI